MSKIQAFLKASKKKIKEFKTQSPKNKPKGCRQVRPKDSTNHWL